MHILVACETSGTVREAFRKLGHNVQSCDLLPSDDNSVYHTVGDVKKLLRPPIGLDKWDLVVMHPPCTALAVSGNAWYGQNMPKNQKRIEAIAWTLDLWEMAKKYSHRVVMENPVGVLPIKATQYVQPWQFGHPESKKTGLWLHNLPKLKESNNVYSDFEKLPKNKQQRLHYLPPSADRWKIRSKTFQGIADAMAQQWGAKD